MSHPLLEELKEFKRQFKEKAQAAIKNEFKTFFDKHPEVGSVAWTQYTPYFNDGDTCEFGVNDFHFLPDSDESVDDSDYDDYDVCLVRKLENKARGEWDRDRRAWCKGTPLTAEEQTLVDDARALTSLCHGLDETMKDVFDDHCRIVAKRSGFDVQEYEHD